MLKPSFRNIALFWFIKYMLFYILRMFKIHDFTLLEINQLRNAQDVFYYLWIFLFMPVVCIIILAAPMYFVFRIKNGFLFLLLIYLILIIEYILYTYFASQSNLTNGLYNGLISILILILFYFKSIWRKLNSPN
jgi:hypothetical protein